MCQQECCDLASDIVEVAAVLQSREISVASQEMSAGDAYMKQWKRVDPGGVERSDAVSKFAPQCTGGPMADGFRQALFKASSRELERECSEREEQLGVVFREEFPEMEGLCLETGRPLAAPGRWSVISVAHGVADIEVGRVDPPAESAENFALNTFQDRCPDVVASRVPRIERLDQTLLPSRRDGIRDQPHGEGL